MALVDIAYLKKENIQNGVICYARRKTGQLLSVRIEPSIQRIIDRYSSALSPYVFPLLTSMDTKEAYEEYQVAINNHNRQLKRLSKMLPAGCKLTSYTSRHSWALLRETIMFPFLSSVLVWDTPLNRQRRFI